MPVTFHVNGEPVRHDGPADRRLLAILREDLALTGAKPGCEVGRCGACLVWLDGEPVNACLVMAWQLDGRRVTTIEAVATDLGYDNVSAFIAMFRRATGVTPSRYADQPLAGNSLSIARETPP